MGKRIIIYGVALAMFSIGLQVLQYRLVIIDHSLELYGGALALVFTILGLYVGRKLTGKNEVIVEKTVFVPQVVTVQAVAEPIQSKNEPRTNEQLITKLGISKREHEILQFMAEGYSNQEIADRAFVSVSTVKTHVSNLFVKLDVQRRTQAVNKAKELRLVP